MRRTRRYRLTHLSFLFFVYTVVHVSLQSENVAEPTRVHDATATPTQSKNGVKEELSTAPIATTTKTEKEDGKKQEAKNDSKHPSKIEHAGGVAGDLFDFLSVGDEDKKEVGKPATKEGDSKLVHAAGGIAAAGMGLHEHIKEKYKEENETIPECTPPAMKQFPHPIMSASTRRHGGLIIHVTVAIYMFIGLAIVSDEYFVASLDRICEELNMSPDVAGATFMAAGSSAPELATVIIGVFLAKDDIGISGVIGSAVFNVMFVISVCALATSTVVYLNWWPLVRDCTFYAISIIVMLLVIYDENISWFGSTVMLLTYGLYCVVLRFNTALEKWAHTLPIPFNVPKPPNEESGLVSYKTLDEDANKIPTYGVTTPDLNWPDENADQSYGGATLSGAELNQSTTAPPPPAAAAPVAAAIPPAYYKPKEYDPAAHINPLVKPIDGSIYAKCKWILLFPIHWMCIHTMPNCRTEQYKNWYPFTFFMSMVWISFYSYFMVWMITIIGFTLGIPDTVMGLTFIAAGVSVPDALSSIAVIKEGYGDMAVSNAIGSNVFDILVCLGLPWFIQTAIVHPGSSIRVISRGINYSTLSLLSTVIFLVVATHYNGWKLDRRFGIILMVWYLVFIVIASLYELNVFNNSNPPQCFLDW